MAHKMTPDDMYAFLREASRTGHLATVREDGRAHVAPLWFVLDGDDIVFTTFRESVKGGNLIRTGRAALSVDDPNPPFSFVALEGEVTISEDSAEVLHWATVIGGKYMGEDQAEAIGKRSDIPGELVCRLHPAHMTGIRNLTQ